MQKMESMAETSEQATVHSGKGTVKKIDTNSKKVMLSHEPIESLSWPAMTMGFAVEDASLFNYLSIGKTIVFEFIKSNNGYVITAVK